MGGDFLTLDLNAAILIQFGAGLMELDHETKRSLVNNGHCSDFTFVIDIEAL